ncbi:MAG: response regulator [Proteobacteria bacterium]|nr:response regulator [Pseudomonadota bacterium]
MLRKVLVIDDEDVIRQTIRKQLDGTGFEIIEAKDGEQGIELLNTLEDPSTVDVIICDIRMPKINGVEAIAYFRQEYPATPIIVLTGYPDVTLATNLLKQGVTEYLTKPVDRQSLVEVVMKAAQRRTPLEGQSK